jgi:cytoskeletal protein CcmA (bactofilin family)
MTAFGALPDSKGLYFWPLLVVHIEVESKSSQYFSQEVTLMETTKAPDTARAEITIIGKSIVIKGELSCSEELYVDGQVEGVIDPKGNRLTVGPNGRVKANVNASVVVVQGKLDGNVQASDRVDLKQSAVVTGDIAAQRISIDEGAYFKGRVNIQREAPKKEVVRAAAS